MNENWLVFLIGVLFGVSLDLAGFGSAKKLNQQFLLRDFAMIKVMLGAVVVASGVYLIAVHFGAPPAHHLLPTLEIATLLGGVLLGAGLVIGGYCPGTALVGAAGGRLDAFIFASSVESVGDRRRRQLSKAVI